MYRRQDRRAGELDMVMSRIRSSGAGSSARIDISPRRFPVQSRFALKQRPEWAQTLRLLFLWTGPLDASVVGCRR